jgi:peptidoglycan/LPS O-acetylase OafA/YrhL
MLLAALEVRHPRQFHRLRRWPYLALGLVYLVVGSFTTILPVALATGIGTALVMGWTLHRDLPGARVLAFLGGASYAMYMWHKDAFIAFGPVIGLSIALVASGLSWALVERPLLARAHWLAARLRGATDEQPAAAVASAEPAQ